MSENIVQDKSSAFAVRIIRLYKYLCDSKKEFILSKQVLRSGTSIGANVTEATQAQSRKDFIAKMSIALKEASETNYWLRTLYSSKYLTNKQFKSVYKDNCEIEKLLVAIIKTAKTNIEKRK